MIIILFVVCIVVMPQSPCYGPDLHCARCFIGLGTVSLTGLSSFHTGSTLVLRQATLQMSPGWIQSLFYFISFQSKCAQCTSQTMTVVKSRHVLSASDTINIDSAISKLMICEAEYNPAQFPLAV